MEIPTLEFANKDLKLALRFLALECNKLKPESLHPRLKKALENAEVTLKEVELFYSKKNERPQENSEPSLILWESLYSEPYR